MVEVGEGTWVEEFGGIEVPVRVEMGDVGADAAVGAGDVAAEETAGVGDVGTDAAVGAGDVAAEETAGVGDVVDGGVSSGTGEVVTGETTRAVEAVLKTARSGRA